MMELAVVAAVVVTGALTLLLANQPRPDERAVRVRVEEDDPRHEDREV